MKTLLPKPRLGSRGQPEESRASILQAAVCEFSREGIAGARTDAIARHAKVNKALLYYYFKDKEALYSAVLDLVFEGLTIALEPAFSQNAPPADKILAYAGAHFDYIASHPLYPRIVQSEMMRAGQGGNTQLDRIVTQYFRPLFGKIAQVIQQGVAMKQFRAVDPVHFIPSMISIIVFYFTNAPVMRILTGADPMSPEAIARRRTAVLDLISSALFLPEIQTSQGERA